MKIALGLEYPLALRGGVSVLVEALTKGLSGRYEIVLVSPDAAGFHYPGIHAHVHWNPAAVSRGNSAALAERLSDIGVQIAHFHFGGNYGWGSRMPGQSPFRFLKRRGIACLSTIHVILAITEGYCGPEKPLWFKLLLLPGGWLGKLDVLRNVQTEIIISQQGCDKARRWYWPFRNKFQVVYHSRIDASQPQTVLKREPLILGVGHIAFRKGQHLLTEAFARVAGLHPDWKLVLIGPDSGDGCYARVQEIVRNNNLSDRVSLLGSRDDTMDFMGKAAIFVQASFFEGLPLALQEAMYYKCACVASDVVGNNELIENGRTGLLAAARDEEELARAISELIQDSGKRQLLGREAARSILERGMTIQMMIDRHAEIYANIAVRDSRKTGSLTPAPAMPHRD